jgi:parallel beta-helix repeat protein
VVDVRIRRQVIASWLVLLLAAVPWVGLLSAESSLACADSATITLSDEPIVITSNADFENQGWPGNGSESNPFILDGLSLQSSIWPAINIEDTTAYFVLSNSFFMLSNVWDEVAIITLHNVSNAWIRECEMGELGYDAIGVSGYEISNSSITDCWFSGGIGVILEQSSRCNISNNQITSGIGTGRFGVHLIDASYINLDSNEILYKSDFGVLLWGTNHSTIVDNSIIGGFRCVSIEGEGNVLFGNRLGWARSVIASDDGILNQWDDNGGQGNAWSDYNESGVYEIAGIGHGIDRYPSKLTEDTFGPYIYHLFGYETVDLIGPIDSFLMTAEVTDMSGVDTVLVNISGDVHELTESEINPGFYTADVPYREYSFCYYFWANDSLGNGLRTGLQWGYIHVYDYSTPTSNTTPTTPTIVNHLPSWC